MWNHSASLWVWVCVTICFRVCCIKCESRAYYFTFFLCASYFISACSLKHRQLHEATAFFRSSVNSEKKTGTHIYPTADSIARITSPHILLCTMTHMHLAKNTERKKKTNVRKNAAVAAHGFVIRRDVVWQVIGLARTHMSMPPACLKKNLCANVRAFSHTYRSHISPCSTIIFTWAGVHLTKREKKVIWNRNTQLNEKKEMLPHKMMKNEKAKNNNNIAYALAKLKP